MPLSRRLKSMQAWMLFLVFLLLGIQECLAQNSENSVEVDDAKVVAFVNVALVTMQDEVLLLEQTVVIQGERILSVGPVDAISIPTGATVIDGLGQYLMPGLADMHVHTRIPFTNGPLYLDAGITTVLSLGPRSLDDDAILRERERSRTIAFSGPSMYTVGSQILGGETPEEAERIVRENVERGFDLVKVHGDVSPETFVRLHETARRLGINVTGHAQRKQGMHAVYSQQQDLAHIDEYLYAAFNPKTRGFLIASYGCGLVLCLFLVTIVVRGMWESGRWLLECKPSKQPASFRSVRRWYFFFKMVAWLLFIVLFYTVTNPFSGRYAGDTVTTTMLIILMVFVASTAVVLTIKVRNALRDDAASIRKRISLLFIVGVAWTFVVSSGFLTPRSWRTTDSGLFRIAQDTAESGIWVTPNLVGWNYITRQTGDEFYTLIERPELRYLRPAIRYLWINDNRYRVHEWVAPMVHKSRRQAQFLLSRLVGKLHDANVPLLAGSDSVGTHGVLPGSSLHEELSLLVQAGLSPFEALQTATVNAATYLDAEQEFGKVAAGFRADLVLLTGNPLDNIDNVRTRVGVMKRGRWFPANELETALEQLAEERK